MMLLRLRDWKKSIDAPVPFPRIYPFLSWELFLHPVFLEPTVPRAWPTPPCTASSSKNKYVPLENAKSSRLGVLRPTHRRNREGMLKPFFSKGHSRSALYLRADSRRRHPCMRLRVWPSSETTTRFCRNARVTRDSKKTARPHRKRPFSHTLQHALPVRTIYFSTTLYSLLSLKSLLVSHLNRQH